MTNVLRKKSLGLCLGLSLGLMAGCSFVVVYPAALQTSSQDYTILTSGQLQIRVTFNAEVDMGSLMEGVNVILVTEKDPNATITIAPGATPADILITSALPYGDLLEFDPDGFFTLELLGSGDHPIMNVDGEVLDGDMDDNPGGDYETTFLLLG